MLILVQKVNEHYRGHIFSDIFRKFSDTSANNNESL